MLTTTQNPSVSKDEGFSRGATFVPGREAPDTLVSDGHAMRGDRPGGDIGALSASGYCAECSSPLELPGPFTCRAATGLTPLPGSLEARLTGYSSRSTLCYAVVSRRVGPGGRECQRQMVRSEMVAARRDLCRCSWRVCCQSRCARHRLLCPSVRVHPDGMLRTFTLQVAPCTRRWRMRSLRFTPLARCGAVHHWAGPGASLPPRGSA